MIKTPLKFNVEGKFRIKRIDTRTGKVDLDTGYNKNMLTDKYLDKIFTDHEQPILSYHEWGKFDELDQEYYATNDGCKIGSGTTAPDRSDDELKNELASDDERNNHDRNSDWTGNTAFIEKEYIFEAGTGTGDINEVGMYGGYQTSYGSSDVEDLFARQVLDNTITKEDYHKLIVYWRLELSLDSRTFTGTISGGQRDGTTDVDWELTINDKQFEQICVTKANPDDANPFSALFDISYGDGNVKVIAGDSNASSDISNDSDDTIKGNELFNDKIDIIEPDDYSDGSYTRTSRIGFEDTSCNGDIGEIVVANAPDHEDYIFRVTFDPKLDKVDDYRLYLDFKISVNPT